MEIQLLNDADDFQVPKGGRKKTKAIHLIFLFYNAFPMSFSVVFLPSQYLSLKSISDVRKKVKDVGSSCHGSDSDVSLN